MNLWILLTCIARYLLQNITSSVSGVLSPKGCLQSLIFCCYKISSFAIGGQFVCDFDSFDSVGADLVTHDTVPSRQYHFHKQSAYVYLLVSLLQTMILATKWVPSFQLFPYLLSLQRGGFDFTFVPLMWIHVRSAMGHNRLVGTHTKQSKRCAH